MMSLFFGNSLVTWYLKFVFLLPEICRSVDPDAKE
jgi:hypothetical protein